MPANNPPNVDIGFMLPYSARIRAHVRLGNVGGTGLRIARNGQLFYGQSQLTVTRKTVGSGTGIDIPNQRITTNSIPARPTEAIWKQQFSTFSGNPLTATYGGFMLVTSNITTQINNQTTVSNNRMVDVTVQNV